MNRVTRSGQLRAMSTTVSVVSVGVTAGQHHDAMAVVADELETWENRFSRFRPDSMLSTVNGAEGRWTPVDDEFLHLLETSRTGVIATHGRFNPAILQALESNGYDRDIDQVQRPGHVAFTSSQMVSGEDVWMLVGIDWAGMRVQLPPGMRIDFGGIAKGVLADRLADRFGTWPGGAVSIGGDMCVWGDAPDGDTWRVGIEHPLNSEHDIATVNLSGDRSAVATTSRSKRAWRTTVGMAHHLIDPFTGASATSSLLAVTACAPTAMMAEVVTKNLMIAAAHQSLTTDLLLDSHWAMTISENLNLTRIAKEAA